MLARSRRVSQRSTSRVRQEGFAAARQSAARRASGPVSRSKARRPGNTMRNPTTSPTNRSPITATPGARMPRAVRSNPIRPRWIAKSVRISTKIQCRSIGARLASSASSRSASAAISGRSSRPRSRTTVSPVSAASKTGAIAMPQAVPKMRSAPAIGTIQSGAHPPSTASSAARAKLPRAAQACAVNGRPAFRAPSACFACRIPSSANPPPKKTTSAPDGQVRSIQEQESHEERDQRRPSRPRAAPPRSSAGSRGTTPGRPRRAGARPPAVREPRTNARPAGRSIRAPPSRPRGPSGARQVPVSGLLPEASCQFSTTVVGLIDSRPSGASKRNRWPSALAAYLLRALPGRMPTGKRACGMPAWTSPPAGPDLDRHELLVGSPVEELLAVAPPARIAAAGIGDLPPPGAVGECLDVDLRAAGLGRRVRDEAPVGRKRRDGSR